MVCYADFCDVFRCQGYLQVRLKKKKNLRGTFTKIFGSQEALYDLGINVAGGLQDEPDEEFHFLQDIFETEAAPDNKNALMTMLAGEWSDTCAPETFSELAWEAINSGPA